MVVVTGSGQTYLDPNKTMWKCEKIIVSPWIWWVSRIFIKMFTLIFSWTIKWKVHTYIYIYIYYVYMYTHLFTYIKYWCKYNNIEQLYNIRPIYFESLGILRHIWDSSEVRVDS
jgi:hypothetical protein